MRELFNKAMIEKLSSAKYAVNEIQKQVNLFWDFKFKAYIRKLIFLWLIKLQCCGNVGPSEYAGDIPPTCSSYVIGCNQAFYDFFWRNILLISLIGLIFGLFQVSAF